MRNNLIFILLVLSSFSLNAQQKNESNLQNRIDRIESNIKEIEEQSITKNKIENLNTKIKNQQKLYDQTINSISTQLDSANYSLTLFGLLITIIAIVLGVYVTYVERKIVRISDENKELLTKNRNIKKEVEELNRLIQSDIYNLFLKIKKEETEHILKRLTKIPKDISNILDSLLSRNLSPDNYSTVRQAYFKLNENDEDYKNQYHFLFFQHFFAQSLRDKQIRKDILNFIPEGIESSFENDIINTTSDFMIIIGEEDAEEFTNEINSFFNGLANSKHKYYQEVYETILQKLNQKHKAFELFKLIESNEKNRVAKIEYGKLLKREFKSDKNTESENRCFKELEKLISEQESFEKEQEDKRKKAKQVLKKNKS